MTVSGAGFAKPAVEKTLPWKYVCCTPSGVISGLPSLSRGSQRLGFTADANVSHSYPLRSIATCNHLVVCSLFAHHVLPSETAISKRMVGLLMGQVAALSRLGVQKQRCCPWGITWAEKLQLSVFLPNDLSLDDWYAEV